jgi:CheY-like chemotaxis protein
LHCLKGRASVTEVEVTIIVAEDDDDDFLLLELALGNAGVLNAVVRVHDGQELLDWLWANAAGRRNIILLDLNMPVMSGFEALSEIKSDPMLRLIPVVVMTTSTTERDMVKSYYDGANAFVSKPLHPAELVELVKVLQQHWINSVWTPVI